MGDHELNMQATLPLQAHNVWHDLALTLLENSLVELEIALLDHPHGAAAVAFREFRQPEPESGCERILGKLVKGCLAG
jgi:hypothetical protein